MKMKEFRYPGIQSFQDTDLHRKLFWGRDMEKKSLFHLVLSEDHVIIFAKSGMGKTSLINVGLMELLRAHNYFPLIVRLNNPQKGPIHTIFDCIDGQVKRYDVEFKPGDQGHLWKFFKTAEFWSGDTLLTPILIIDQFEELFTLNYSREVKIKLTMQLSNLVNYGIPTDARTDEKPEIFNLSEFPPGVKVIFSLRENFLPNLEELSPYFPGIFQNRFWLGPLNFDNAREAIEKPALLEDEELRSSSFSYTPEAMNSILEFLSGYQPDGAPVKREKEIEPYQIQLICQYIENLAIKNQKKKIDFKDLGGTKGIRSIITNFYEKQIEQCRNIKERKKIRGLCEGLISKNGYRLSLEKGEIEKNYEVSEEHLKKLVDCRLLRAEPRLKSVYYELSHDTLIEPILNTKEKIRKNIKKKRFVIICFIVILLILISGIFYYMKNLSKERLNRSLHYAVNYGYNIDLTLFIKEGADPNSKTAEGLTPLSVAIENGDRKITDILLRSGANINLLNDDSSTPLIMAVKSQNEKIVKLLLEKGADRNLGNKLGDTPLIMAVKSQNEKIVKLLLEKGANINLGDKLGNTPFIIAAKSGNNKIAKLLLEEGANINKTNNFGDTPFMVAAYRKHENIAKFLLEQGAEVDIQNNIGDTALMDAAKIGHLELVKMLIEKDADPNLKNKLGMKAWHWANKGTHTEVMEFLEKKTQIDIKRISFVLLYEPFPEKYIPHNVDRKVLEGISIQREAYKSGDNSNPNYIRALEKFTEAANQSNDAFAMFKIGRAYTYGLGTPQDFDKAFEWYKKAAELGDPWAQNSLAFAYQYGLGTNGDCEKAKKWFQKSADQSNPWGAVGLGDMYLIGYECISQSPEEALIWYRLAARNNSPRGQNNLGDTYRKGTAIKRSLKSAIYWYEKAAKQGDIYAIVSLGQLYREGKGVNRSLGKAFRLFLEAAERDSHYAQYSLGRAYEFGEGVSPSLVEAVKWYRLAAARGLGKAENRLRKLGIKP